MFVPLLYNYSNDDGISVNLVTAHEHIRVFVPHQHNLACDRNVKTPALHGSTVDDTPSTAIVV